MSTKITPPPAKIRQEERLLLIAEALDDIDRHIVQRKKWVENWKTEHEVLLQSLGMLRDDVRQMRLDEQEGL
jgi:hypothetical protein